MTRTWIRPADVGAAACAVASGATAFGGGAALLSAAFDPTVAEDVVDLAGLGLATLDAPRIGAMATLAAVAADPAVVRGWPAIAQAAAQSANPEVRRLATIGGTIAARIATADLPAALCAHGARVEVQTVDGARWRSVADHLAAPLPGVITAVDLGAPAPGGYRRLAGRAGPAPAIATVAAVRRDGELVLWAGAVADRPLCLVDGALPETSALRDDHRASAAHRRRMIAVLVQELRDELANDTGPR
jgi:CO/xanthine dehydrogenase FAD-binding subunit